MAEYIDREALIKGRHACKRDCATCDFAVDGDSWCEGELFVVDVLRAPAADVRENMRGRWRQYSPLTDTYECDKCGYQVIDESFCTNFCPNCGADMRPEGSNE